MSAAAGPFTLMVPVREFTGADTFLGDDERLWPPAIRGRLAGQEELVRSRAGASPVLVAHACLFEDGQFWCTRTLYFADPAKAGGSGFKPSAARRGAAPFSSGAAGRLHGWRP